MVTEAPQITELARIVGMIQEDINEQISQNLLNFFGSIDEMVRYGYLYKIEAEPVRMELMTHSDFNQNVAMCQTMVKIRIRYKTREELEADRRD